MKKKLAIGLDIGTTTICMVVLDAMDGEILETMTTSNNAEMVKSCSWEKVQDAAVLLEQVENMLLQVADKYSEISCVGITGQMHGIVYIDESGCVVSPLFTWQDERGNLIYKSGLSYGEYLSELTGYKLSTGFGAVTHFYNQVNHLVPERAKSFCTIMDYIAMRLSKAKVPLIHPSNAASIGLFDIKKSTFDWEAIERAGLELSFFPKVVKGTALYKKSNHIPYIAAAIGDNQASFIGSVKEKQDGILVNIGTSSQISIYFSRYGEIPGLETRPLIEDDYILVGSPLCGGRSYALLENFFREIAELAGQKNPPKLYEMMKELSRDFSQLKDPLEIKPQFCGTREKPYLRGEVHNLSPQNFTARHFTIGMLRGIAQEIYELYKAAKPNLPFIKTASLTGSGNALRMNDALQQMVEQYFEKSICIPVHKEEASFGAALFALTASGHFGTIEEAQKLIKYQ